MSPIQIRRQHTDADIPAVESAMTEGSYRDSDFEAQFQEGMGFPAPPGTPPNKTLMVKHKATETERGFVITANSAWEEGLKRAFTDQVFGH